ncbi:hypothetical protein [Nostoc sp.]|uniref:hypothetical protein n=1 Tax=Nostoc sp. TaxID=1180 RepID=UPI002FF4EA9B
MSAKDFAENLDTFYKGLSFICFGGIFKYNYLIGVTQSQQEAIFGICYQPGLLGKSDLELLNFKGLDKLKHQYYKLSGGFTVFTFPQMLTQYRSIF